MPIREQDWINPNSGRVTVTELGNTWLSTLSPVKPSTRELYQQVWRGCAKPEWGLAAVASIKPFEVQQWVSGVEYSPSWVRPAHNVLAQVLDVAVADRRVRENPAPSVKLPRKVPTVKVYWTLEKLHLFAAECGDSEDFILILRTSGLRWGEAIVLRPHDLSPERHRIHVVRNAAKVVNGIRVGTPKTHER